MRSFCVISYCIIFVALVSADTTWSQVKSFEFDGLSLIWTADYDKNEQVYFSDYKEDTWSAPIQISNSEFHVFHAAGAIAHDGTIWCVWTQVDKKGVFLYSATYVKDSWSKPAKIHTGMVDNRYVVIVMDSKDTPWIAWTAVDDTYSDVFWSRWNGTGWSMAHKAHSDDNVPDVKPLLKSNINGNIELSWDTFSDGNSVTVSLQWDGEAWIESSLDMRKKELVIEKRRSHSLPRLPKFIREHYKASFFYRDNHGAGAIAVKRK